MRHRMVAAAIFVAASVLPARSRAQESSFQTSAQTASAQNVSVLASASAIVSRVPALGIGADLNGYQPFPSNNPWNTPINNLPVNSNSQNYLSSIGLTKSLHPDFGANWNGGPFGIPYIVVGKGTPRLPLVFGYADESDAGPYPIPPDAPIEGGDNSTGDRHVLVLDRDARKLYETYSSYPVVQNGAVVGWNCGSGAIFDLKSNAVRPAGWTSADAAGLPIFPGLVRYDEVARGVINHALRFTVSRSQRGYIFPARHFASRSRATNLAPMGLRVRLKASYDISRFPAQARVVLQCLKTYGMIVADNGSDWFLSGAPDARWSDNQLNTLKTVKGSNFEVVQTGAITKG